MDYSDRVDRLISLALESRDFYGKFFSEMERELRSHISLVDWNGEFLYGNSRYENCISLGKLGSMYMSDKAVNENYRYIRAAAVIIYYRMEIDRLDRYSYMWNNLIENALRSLTEGEYSGVRAALLSQSGTSAVNISEIAEQTGLTRSVIVNGLHKLECTGLLELRSGGTKGTYVRVLSNDLIEKLRRDKGEK